MRILEISPYNFVAGGSDRYFLEVSRLLADAGHEVHRFCKRDPRSDPSQDEPYFVDGIDPARGGIGDALTMIYSRSAARKLDALLEAHPVDLVHMHIYYGHFSGSILPVLRRRGIPSVQTVHDYKPACPTYAFNRHGEICEACDGGKFWHALKFRCNRGSLARSALSMTEAYVTDRLGARSGIDRYIAVCRFQADRLIAHGLPAERTDVLYNFVDTADFPKVFRTQAPDSIVYFGRIEESKGVGTLLDAFLSLPRERRRGVRLRFAGGGGYVETLKQRIADCGDPAVEYLGFVRGEEIAALFETALCMVLTPKVYENCSMAVLESLSRGVAVIGSRMGGIPEIVEDGVDGLIVPPENPAALAAALASLIDDPARAIAMGDAGHEKILRDFNPRDHLGRLTGIFEEVIARKASG